jgi:hypothetical protein
MLSPLQIAQFRADGYLVVPDIIPTNILVRLKAEYSALIDDLYADWYKQGLVTTQPKALNFWGKLLCAYQAGCDYFQPMDISLPGDRIKTDTPFHIGPAVFDMLTAKPLLDAVEQLIGPELTSNPIQHVRIKPPSNKLNSNEIRPHIAATDWHQDRAVALEDADCDHILALVEGGTNCLDNFQLLCRTPCHQEKSNDEQFRASYDTLESRFCPSVYEAYVSSPKTLPLVFQHHHPPEQARELLMLDCIRCRQIPCPRGARRRYQFSAPWTASRCAREHWET